MNDIEKSIVELLVRRAPDKSICPSEVAREIAGDGNAWRSLMEPVRETAAQMAKQKVVRITQGESEVDLSLPVKGPVRIRRGSQWPTTASNHAGKAIASGTGAQYPKTPDGRYFVVRDRLWRAANPHLPAHKREALVQQLMDARRALRGNRPDEERAEARKQVDEAKRALGERGPVWWTDGSPDFNRKMVKNTPYAEWYTHLAKER